MAHNRYKNIPVRYKVYLWFVVAFTLLFGTMYGISKWYTATQSSKPSAVGVSFIAPYAESLGLDPKETMDALINDVGVRHFRLVSYWNQLEPTPGTYDFRLLDWQFEKAEQAGARVTLSLGLRQPRWPECHIPDWAKDMKPGYEEGPMAEWQPQLERFMTEVVNRYKDSPALTSYQVENEFFLRGFGTCTDFDRRRLIREYELVKRLDPDHKIIISRSNNAIGWPVNEPTPDEFGISIYKRVWSPQVDRYMEYPYPDWYYGFLGGWQKLVTGRDLMIHELQAETWPPRSKPIQKASLAEQNDSFSADIFRKRMEFAQGTGLREMYLWGGEYWYYRKVQLNDPSLWDVAKEVY